MIVCSSSDADNVCEFVGQNVNVAYGFEHDLMKLHEWRKDHYDGIAILIGDYKDETIADHMKIDSGYRHACITYVDKLRIPSQNETLIYTQNAEVNVQVVLSLDPGEKHLGVALIRLQNRMVLNIDAFVYDSKAFLNSDFVSNPKMGVTWKTNEAIMHLLSYAMQQGKLMYVIIENQAAQNTKAAAMLSAILMACQMMEIPCDVMAPTVKFTKMGMATPKIYANRKALSVKIYRDRATHFKINCPGNVPPEYSNIIVTGEKEDDKADAVYQGLITCIRERLVSFKVDLLIEICKRTVEAQAKVDESAKKELDF